MTACAVDGEELSASRSTDAQKAAHVAKMRQMMEEKAKLEADMQRELLEYQERLSKASARERIEQRENAASVVKERIEAEVKPAASAPETKSKRTKRQTQGRFPNPPKTVRVDQNLDFRAKHVRDGQSYFKQGKTKLPKSDKGPQKESKTRPPDAARNARSAVEWAEKRKIAVLEAQRIRKMREKGLDPFPLFPFPFFKKAKKKKRHKRLSSSDQRVAGKGDESASVSSPRLEVNNQSKPRRPASNKKRSSCNRPGQVRIIVATQPLGFTESIDALFSPPKSLAAAARLEEEKEEGKLAFKHSTANVTTISAPQEEKLWTCTDCRFPNAQGCGECVLCGLKEPLSKDGDVGNTPGVHVDANDDQGDDDQGDDDQGDDDQGYYEDFDD